MDMNRHGRGREGTAGPVMAALDFSFDGVAAVRYAAVLARRLRRDLHVIHIARLFTPTGPTIMSGQTVRRTFARARTGIDDVISGLRTSFPDLVIHPLIVAGDPAELLIKHSAQAAMTVAGARGLGGHPGLVWGSVSNRLVSRAHGPVIVVRSASEGGEVRAGDGPVLVLADSPERAEAATDFAIGLEPDRTAYVVTVYRPAAAGDLPLRTEHLPLDHMVIRVAGERDSAVDEVSRLAWRFDARLVAVARTRHGWPFRFGPASTMSRLAGAVACPLAVVDTTPVAGGGSAGAGIGGTSRISRDGGSMTGGDGRSRIGTGVAVANGARRPAAVGGSPDGGIAAAAGAGA